MPALHHTICGAGAWGGRFQAQAHRNILIFLVYYRDIASNAHPYSPVAARHARVKARGVLLLQVLGCNVVRVNAVPVKPSQNRTEASLYAGNETNTDDQKG